VNKQRQLRKAARVRPKQQVGARRAAKQRNFELVIESKDKRNVLLADQKNEM